MDDYACQPGLEARTAVPSAVVAPADPSQATRTGPCARAFSSAAAEGTALPVSAGWRSAPPCRTRCPVPRGRRRGRGSRPVARPRQPCGRPRSTRSPRRRSRAWSAARPFGGLRQNDAHGRDAVGLALAFSFHRRDVRVYLPGSCPEQPPQLVAGERRRPQMDNLCMRGRQQLGAVLDRRAGRQRAVVAGQHPYRRWTFSLPTLILGDIHCLECVPIPGRSVRGDRSVHGRPLPLAVPRVGRPS